MPGGDGAVVLGLADLGAQQHRLELLDLALELALLLAGGVVAAVLLEVALVAGGADPRHDLLAAGTLDLLELGRELVVGVLGQPDGGLLGLLSHGSTPGVLLDGGATPSGRESALRPVRRRPSGTSERTSLTSAAVSEAVSARRRCSPATRPRWPGARCGSRRPGAVRRPGRGERELADGGVVLGVRPQPAGRLDVVVGQADDRAPPTTVESSIDREALELGGHLGPGVADHGPGQPAEEHQRRARRLQRPAGAAGTPAARRTARPARPACSPVHSHT